MVNKYINQTRRLTCFFLNLVINELKSAAIFLISGFAVSPILKTLTETISTDTIYAMVTIMMLIHLTFYDYGAKAAIVSTPVALNAAIFAAVCLASRLLTTYHAFALLIFASDIFVLAAILRTRIRDSSSDRWQAGLTLFFAMTSIICLSTTVSFMYSLLLFLLLICINFLCPLGFYKWQIHKEYVKKFISKFLLYNFSPKLFTWFNFSSIILGIFMAPGTKRSLKQPTKAATSSIPRNQLPKRPNTPLACC